MRRKKNREIDTFSLSFLDCICCGFGAIILLLVITKMYEPVRLDEAQESVKGLIAKLQEELFDIRGETEVVTRELTSVTEQIDDDKTRLAILRRDFSRIRASFLATREDSDVTLELEGQLAEARQSLSEEMRLLLKDYRPPSDSAVGGIPVDSEYVVFLIDTSPSMRQYAWKRVQEQIEHTLEVYPTVKGIQVMNDMGEYMFKSYRNKWIPDTPSQRDSILRALGNWSPFSNSSPREGIIAAIRAFNSPDKKISLYVYSDDFSTGSINAVVREIDRLNKADDEGNRLVRIHAVAFPVLYEITGRMATAAKFAMLMRVICQRNGGTFVALPGRRGFRVN